MYSHAYVARPDYPVASHRLSLELSRSWNYYRGRGPRDPPVGVADRAGTKKNARHARGMAGRV